MILPFKTTGIPFDSYSPGLAPHARFACWILNSFTDHEGLVKRFYILKPLFQFSFPKLFIVKNNYLQLLYVILLRKGEGRTINDFYFRQLMTFSLHAFE